MPPEIELLQEAYRRGILSGNKEELYNEAVRRGLVQDDISVQREAPAESLPTEPLRDKEPVWEGATSTLKNIGMVYPAAETAANLLTSIYGFPVSGLAGLAALPLGLDKAKEVVAAIQKFMIYEPQTEAGTDLLKAIMFPVEQMEKHIAAPIGDKIARTGYPNLGAAVYTGIMGAPAIAGGGKILLKPSIKRIGKKISRQVSEGIEKGIRPAVRGRRRYSQGAAYRKKAESAVRYIIEAKNDLTLTDVSGNIVKGRLPQNLKQFSQAIEQCRRKIFLEYDQVARIAGEKKVGAGLRPIVKKPPERPIIRADSDSLFRRAKIAATAQKWRRQAEVPLPPWRPPRKVVPPVKKKRIKINEVNLRPIAHKLQEVSRHKVVSDINPELAAYAESLATRFIDRKIYTTMEAQDAIATLNNSLEAFYKNPSYENASKSYVDSLMVNNLRKSLDTVIEKTTGMEYQKLKNQYGSLKAIEQDVYRRALVDARKNKKGLLDFTDIFSGFHVIHGILNLNPAVVGAGAASKGLAVLYRLKNDPNKIIKRMFSETEKLISRETAGRIYKKISR